jgi:hypothetical protein
MSAQIIDAPAIRNSDGCVSQTVHHGTTTFACNNLATWMLQRYPHQRGRWYVSLFVRGLCVSALAVQDDFGNLQLVEA